MQIRFKFHTVIFALVALIFVSATSARADLVPLTRAHAHNDYEHKRPLKDALAQGFCSIEADINLVDGKLLVAHSLKAVKPELTLQSLYLDPLRERIKQNKGRVYPNGPECTLLIDFKTDSLPTYAALRDVLKEYADILTVFHDGVREPKAINVILTGRYPRAALEADKVRYAAADGKVTDLDTNPSATLVPWISENWGPLFTWRGKGTIPPEDAAKLKSIVERAHEQGRKVRFWGAPDKPEFWKELLEQGVDLINTDDLKGFRQFYLGQ